LLAENQGRFALGLLQISNANPHVREPGMHFQNSRMSQSQQIETDLGNTGKNNVSLNIEGFPPFQPTSKTKFFIK